MDEIVTDEKARSFYKTVLRKLNKHEFSYLVGGAAAFGEYTGIYRDTKDFDIFCTKKEAGRIIAFIKKEEYNTAIPFPWWIAKIYQEDAYIDIIYHSGNSLCPVDDLWFDNANRATVFGIPVKLVPAEEMIWQKAFVQSRERFDGADIYHILLKRGRQLDWKRLLSRMEKHWEILFAHIINFRYIYPSEKDIVPPWLLDDLTKRFTESSKDHPQREKICRGTILSIGSNESFTDYKTDIEKWGFKDMRKYTTCK